MKPGDPPWHKLTKLTLEEVETTLAKLPAPLREKARHLPITFERVPNAGANFPLHLTRGVKGGGQMLAQSLRVAYQFQTNSRLSEVRTRAHGKSAFSKPSQ